MKSIKRQTIGLILALSIVQNLGFAGHQVAMATEFTQYKKYIDEANKRKKQFDTWVNQNLTLEAQLKRLSTFSDAQLKAMYRKDPDRFKRMGRTVDNLTKSIQNVASIEAVMSDKIKGYSTTKLSSTLAAQYKAGLDRANQKLEMAIKGEGITANVKSTGDRLSAVLSNIGNADSPTKAVQLATEAMQGVNDTARDLETAYASAKTDKMLEKAQQQAEDELAKKKAQEAKNKAQKDMRAIDQMANRKPPTNYKKVREEYFKKHPLLKIGK